MIIKMLPASIFELASYHTKNQIVLAVEIRVTIVSLPCLIRVYPVYIPYMSRIYPVYIPYL